MVTRIHKMAPRKLFLREHRRVKGVSAEAMAGRLGMERESVLRIEREPQRVKSEMQAAYAAALDMQPEDLWRPPGSPSVDSELQQATPEVQAMVVDVVRRMLGKAG